ncbi:hypothetical protein GCM10022248_30740 [Nonomuraea soli]
MCWAAAEQSISRDRARARYLAVREGGPGGSLLAAFAKEFPGHAVEYPDAVLVTMEPEEMDEVSNRVFAAAAAQGLVCYDPQRDLVHNRGPLGVYPEMQLHTGDGMIVVNPDLGLVRDFLGTLSPGNPFAALVVFGQHFIQVSPGYELEYKEGFMRRAMVGDLEEVRRAFAEYANGERGFLDRHDWVRV